MVSDSTRELLTDCLRSFLDSIMCQDCMSNDFAYGTINPLNTRKFTTSSFISAPFGVSRRR